MLKTRTPSPTGPTVGVDILNVRGSGVLCLRVRPWAPLSVDAGPVGLTHSVTYTFGGRGLSLTGTIVPRVSLRDLFEEDSPRHTDLGTVSRSGTGAPEDETTPSHLACVCLGS